MTALYCAEAAVRALVREPLQWALRYEGAINAAITGPVEFLLPLSAGYEFGLAVGSGWLWQHSAMVGTFRSAPSVLRPSQTIGMHGFPLEIRDRTQGARAR